METGKRRGNNKKRINERELIREHIRLFPTKDTHYCRKDTKKRYLHERLSVHTMYKMYVVWCQEKNYTPQKEHMYMEAFAEDFNLSFVK